MQRQRAQPRPARRLDAAKRPRTGSCDSSQHAGLRGSGSSDGTLSLVVERTVSTIRAALSAAEAIATAWASPCHGKELAETASGLSRQLSEASCMAKTLSDQLGRASLLSQFLEESLRSSQPALAAAPWPKEPRQNGNSVPPARPNVAEASRCLAIVPVVVPVAPPSSGRARQEEIESWQKFWAALEEEGWKLHPENGKANKMYFCPPGVAPGQPGVRRRVDFFDSKWQVLNKLHDSGNLSPEWSAYVDQELQKVQDRARRLGVDSTLPPWYGVPASERQDSKPQARTAQAAPAPHGTFQEHMGVHSQASRADGPGTAPAPRRRLTCKAAQVEESRDGPAKRKLSDLRATQESGEGRAKQRPKIAGFTPAPRLLKSPKKPARLPKTGCGLSEMRARELLAHAAESGEKIKDKDVIRVLDVWNFRNNTRRKNVMREGVTAVSSEMLGLIRIRVYNKFSVAEKSTKFPHVTKLLCQYFKDHPPAGQAEGTAFPFTTVCINKNYAAKRHRDVNNVGLSVIRALGEFTGGKVRYWPSDTGKGNVEDLQDADAVELDVQHRTVCMRSTLAHEVKPFEGTRYSLVYFSVSHYERAETAVRTRLAENCGIELVPLSEAHGMWPPAAA